MTIPEAAYTVLTEHGRPEHYNVIYKLIIERGLACVTNPVSIVATIGKDISAAGAQSRFVRFGNGYYGLKGQKMTTLPPVRKKAANTASREVLGFDAFRQEWLADIKSGNTSTTGKGQHFARKLYTDAYQVEYDAETIAQPDGRGDGGIDLVDFDLAGSDAADRETGDRCFIVMSKYGAAMKGARSVLEDCAKVEASLTGTRKALSTAAKAAVTRIVNFAKNASQQDEVILAFASEYRLDAEAMAGLEYFSSRIGKALGVRCRHESLSLEGLYSRAQGIHDEEDDGITVEITLPARVLDIDSIYKMASTSVLDWHEFLKQYQYQTNDLERIFSRNVRMYLGRRKKVNKDIYRTVRDQPEHFHLFNNGVRIICELLRVNPDGTITLRNPFVVNGCQTSRSLYDAVRDTLSGGTGIDPETEEWMARARTGQVPLVILAVSAEDAALIDDITRYTNSQNPVSEKDQLALNDTLRALAYAMKEQKGVFLEIQKGESIIEKNRMKGRPEASRFKYANAFEVVKVLGAGWYGKPGVALARNDAFLPGGEVYELIIGHIAADECGVDDFYAAYHVFVAAQGLGFGSRSALAGRRKTKFLFDYVAVEMMRAVLQKVGLDASNKTVTQAILALAAQEPAALDVFWKLCAEVIDHYMMPGKDLSIQNEDNFDGDMSSFLKSPDLARARRLLEAVEAGARMMTFNTGGGISIPGIVGRVMSQEGLAVVVATVPAGSVQFTGKRKRKRVAQT